MAEVIERAATWKRLAALYLDFCTVFYGGGYLILLASRETSGRGFHFDGAFALAYAALIILYFVVGRRYAGGTLWDKIFRIGRPQPDDVEIPLKTSDQSVAVRAGFLRRLFALSIDSIIISGLCQLVVASLFVATSGQIQMHGDFTYTNCTTLDKIPDGLTPAPPAGSNLARECNMFFIGAQTAKILQVGHSTKEGTIAKTGSQNYMIDRDSHPNNGVSVDWLAMLALIVYLIVMETRTGATLGSRAMRIRVIDVAAPAGPSVPLRKIVLRYLVMLLGLIPALAGLLVYFGLFGSLDEVYVLLGKLSSWTFFSVRLESSVFQWHPIFGYLLDLPGLLRGSDAASSAAIDWLYESGDLAFKAWAIYLAVQIAKRRDPVYDRMTGTAVVQVVRDLHRVDGVAH